MTFRYSRHQECPDRERLHFDALHPERYDGNIGRPKGYTKMRQSRCPTCGFYAIWEPK